MPDMQELGSVGLKLAGGQIGEEFHPKLRGARGQKVYNEMGANDPIIGGILFAFERTASRLDWHIEPPSEATPQEEEAADFVQECLDDMSDSWNGTISSILSMMQYGWSYHEIVYKYRRGEAATPGESSRHNDGKLGWRKWPIRAQDSLLAWQSDDRGGISGMTQKTEGHPEVTIPIEKALLFRTNTAKGNPEGKSLLRNSYRPWFLKKRIEEIEAIGIERDLAGLPVAWLDPKYLSANATAEEKALLAEVTKIVQSVKRNQTEGVVFPLDYDEHGHKTIDFTLLNSGGSRAFDTDKIISRYNQQIAMSVLADFLLLGHEGVGSQALGDSKIDLWMMAVEALATNVAEVVNQHAIPRLLRLNGVKVERTPKLVFGSVETKDLAALGGYIKNMVDAGIIEPDPELEDYIRDIANLPPVDQAYRDDKEAEQDATDATAAIAALAAAQAAPAPTQPATAPQPGTQQSEEEDKLNA
jgi:phage gp29-like protein